MCTKEVLIRRSITQLQRTDVAKLVQIACEFKASVMIQSDQFQVNARSLLGVIALQMKPGIKLFITAKGPDAEQALETICAWFSQDI